MTQASVWIIGHWKHADFHAPLTWLNRRAECICFDNAPEAIARLRSPDQPRDPSAVLFVQSRPEQIADCDMERVYAVAPLARLVKLDGAWCEGAARTGHRSPGLVHVPWRTWQSSLPRALNLIESTNNAAPPLPRTATEIERIESVVKDFARCQPFLATAAIRTSRRATYESLADGLGALGITSHWHTDESQPPAGVDLVIDDGWEQFLYLSSAGRGGQPAHLLVLDFPRPRDVGRAAELGIAAILARPLLLADLAATLRSVMPRRESCSRLAS